MHYGSVEASAELKALDEWLEAYLRGEATEPPEAGTRARRLLEYAESELPSLEQSPLADPTFNTELAAALGGTGDIGPGARVGPFRIERAIGAGGMGAVYLAHREQGGFEQRVALKVLTGAAPDPASYRQFERERHVLARLEHPGIARLIDGGFTEDARPWFAMEFVDGMPLDRYADEARLSVEARLRLFLEVCRALEYAHGRLVLHGDVKPSNVLVGADGTVKLVDFGLGRIQRRSLEQGDVTATQSGTRWLTPEYASPEQIRGEAVTTSSEVYQLGALLYRLLCGTPPFRLQGATLSTWMDTICRSVPERPSAYWLRDVTEAGAVQAECFGATPEALSRRLRGDLDNIVLTALAKSPESRYRNVGGLIEDLQRHFEHRPVRARAATRRYRLGKFMRRYRVAVATAASVFLLITAALAVIAKQANDLALQRDAARQESERARIEAAKAERVTDYLVGLFEQASPVQAAGRDITATDLLREGAASVEELDESPLVQAEMFKALALANRELTEFDTARELLDRALALLLDSPEATAHDVAEALIWRGRVAHQTDQFEVAERYHRRALERLGPNPADPDLRAFALNHLAIALAAQRHLEQAEATFRESRAAYRETGNQHMVMELTNNLAVFYTFIGRPESAKPLFSDLLEHRLDTLGEDHPLTTQSMRNLAAAMMDTGDLEQAEALYRRALERDIEVYGADSPRVGAIWYRLGRIALARGELDEAETMLLDAKRMRAAKYGDRHSTVGTIVLWLGRLSTQRGDFRQAAERYSEALAVYRHAFGDPHPAVADVQIELGEAFRRLDRPAQARRWYREAVDTAQALPDYPSESLARALVGLAETNLDTGRPAASQAAMEQAAELMAEVRNGADATDAPDLAARMDEVAARLPSVGVD